MSNRGKKKKELKAKQRKEGYVKPVKKSLGSIHDCCGNCKSRFDIFSKFSVKCRNKNSSFFKVEMPKEEHCTAHVH
jgi:hypothetical protein